MLAAIYCIYSLLAHSRFKTSAYDLVIFDQAVRSYAELSPPISILKGVHNNFGPDFVILGDHWSPILALLGPLYWLHDGPETLLVAQAVLFAAAVPVLYKVITTVLLQRTDVGPSIRRAVAGTLCVSYGISWPVIEAIAFDFHEVAFVPLLTVLLVERFQAGKHSHVILVMLALLQVKEDMGLLAIGFGTYLIGVRAWRRTGAFLILLGGAFIYVTTQILIPLFGGRSNYYWAYGALGSNIRESLSYALTHPLYAVSQLWTPSSKVPLIALTLGVTLFLALFSRIAIIALPLALERLLASSFPNWWEPKYHYTAFIVIILFIAAADGIARTAGVIDKRYGQASGRNAFIGTPVTQGGVAIGIASAICAANVISVPFFSLGTMFSKGFYETSGRAVAANHALAAVPDSVLVEASNNLAPALSGRTQTLLWDRTPRWAPWVVADVGAKSFPFTSMQEQLSRVDLLRRSGYRQIVDTGDFIVLHRN
ncbi:DUF2079 domain-containing protein [Spongiactinospora rosea]|uniref:DUF2079 domain-containing protein n=1 Tax=Spongiactinospora rosea TaxID=2248750 RepID=UPI0013148C8D|nr:DUF2079 domain-containing protein [Spongiactinospora rosea]